MLQPRPESNIRITIKIFQFICSIKIGIEDFFSNSMINIRYQTWYFCKSTIERTECWLNLIIDILLCWGAWYLITFFSKRSKYQRLNCCLNIVYIFVQIDSKGCKPCRECKRRSNVLLTRGCQNRGKYILECLFNWF